MSGNLRARGWREVCRVAASRRRANWSAGAAEAHAMSRRGRGHGPVLPGSSGSYWRQQRDHNASANLRDTVVFAAAVGGINISRREGLVVHGVQLPASTAETVRTMPRRTGRAGAQVKRSALWARSRARPWRNCSGAAIGTSASPRRTALCQQARFGAVRALRALRRGRRARAAQLERSSLWAGAAARSSVQMSSLPLLASAQASGVKRSGFAATSAGDARRTASK